jgi:hypothetical protein
MLYRISPKSDKKFRNYKQKSIMLLNKVSVSLYSFHETQNCIISPIGTSCATFYPTRTKNAEYKDNINLLPEAHCSKYHETCHCSAALHGDLMHRSSSRSAVPKRFRSTAPLVPYTHPQRPPNFFKKHKYAFVCTFILYLKNRLNKIIRVKLNVLCVI